MARKILIDTNIAIGYIGNRLSAKSMDAIANIFDAEYHISVINKIELLGYPNLHKNEEEKFNLLINHSILHPIDNKIIEETISIRKGHKIKLPDAIIAATCLVNGLDILTLNTQDFKNIDGLRVIEPETI
ncbi:MAG: type II toxin-antitoxin system VapC family toxin [Prolixibacteraceae bacterium]|jgi:predicted nucleic acid-binding protein